MLVTAIDTKEQIHKDVAWLAPNRKYYTSEEAYVKWKRKQINARYYKKHKELNKMAEKTKREVQRKLKTMLSNLKNKKNVRMIIADGVSKIKNFEYDDFYRNCVQNTYGIWLGSGITDQYTIKSSTYNKQTRSEITNDFGYIVEKGNATYIKLLDFYTEDL